MANKDPQFPGIEASDSDDVRWALETAGAMWDQGDRDGSLRWLKRAADAASEEGEDMRSVRLAKARAELRSFVDLSGEALKAATAQSKPDEAPDASAPPPAPTTPGSPPPTPADRTAKRRPPPPQRGAAPASPPPAQSDAPTAATPAPAKRSTPAPPPAQQSAPEATPPPPAANMDDQPTLQKPLRAEDLALELQQKLAAQGIPIADGSPEAAPAVPTKLAKHQAVRVALQPMDGVPGVMLARPLTEGERPGSGAQLALLVALDENVDLVGESS
ncbi:MAG: hypothetical protein JRI68_31335 [Deltaproteobacteria bacterium]|nr:hypothetical protein [Deltaproteobacteria bacterium]